jgi:hypothetical protein
MAILPCTEQMDVAEDLGWYFFSSLNQYFSLRLQMPGVTVKDVCPHAFVNAFAEYLKQSGKIEVWYMLG